MKEIKFRVWDKKTKKKVEIPKEILELWDVYWEHIQKAPQKQVENL